MPIKRKEYRPSALIEHYLEELRNDYASVMGKPFQHFYCPILLVDEMVPLCMGHIINEACPNSFGGRIPQRADVDQFYGRTFESEFTGNVQARSMSPSGALRDSQIYKKVAQRIIVNGEEWGHYQERGPEGPGHTKVALRIGAGAPLRWVVKKTQEEIDSQQKIDVQLAIGKDCRLFKLLGYSYALSTAGMQMGYELLGVSAMPLFVSIIYGLRV
jgi:hypothetical protein